MLKLKPRQMIGVAAIVVFGGGMIWRATQPSEREVMEQRISSLMAAQRENPIEFPDLPPIDIPDIQITAPLSALDGSSTTGATDNRAIWELSGIDYYSIGSQPAKDDLYCAGVISAEFDATKADAHPDKMSMMIRDMQALDDAGIAKLRAEGHIKDEFTAGYTLAWADKAKKDYTANALRLSFDACTARATAGQ